MKKIYIVLLWLCSLPVAGQTDSLEAVAEVIAFQKKLNDEYKNRQESPLEAKDFEAFQTHDFFPTDLAYRVQANLERVEGTPFFGMKTTTSRVSTERIYGYVSFTLAGNSFRLPVYQSKDMMQTEEYADYLFFPFTDATNGIETYDGGRYIDLRIPKEGDNIVIDFNMAYNPYCAYSAKYSCPLVPAENQMNMEVPVGVKYHKKEKSGTTNVEATSPEVFSKVEVMPEFPGGLGELAKFIGKNLTYPREAVKQKTHGTIYVAFVVRPDGSISDIQIIKGISEACDREAKRVVSLMPKWKPGQVDGENVSTRFVLPINFKGRPGWK